MALPAVPALGAIGKGLGFGGAFKAGSKAVSRAGSRLSGVIGRNVGRFGAAGGGAAGGFGVASVLDSLGVEDQRLRLASIVAAALVALYAVGQLVNLDIDL